MIPGKLYKTKYEITFEIIDDNEDRIEDRTLLSGTIVLFLKSIDDTNSPWIKKYLLCKDKILTRFVILGDFESWFEEVFL